jgi:hypothetical protein
MVDWKKESGLGDWRLERGQILDIKDSSKFKVQS